MWVNHLQPAVTCVISSCGRAVVVQRGLGTGVRVATRVQGTGRGGVGARHQPSVATVPESAPPLPAPNPSPVLGPRAAGDLVNDVQEGGAFFVPDALHLVHRFGRHVQPPGFCARQGSDTGQGLGIRWHEREWEGGGGGG